MWLAGTSQKGTSPLFDVEQQYDTWRYVCREIEKYDMTCLGVEKPLVVKTQIVEFLGAWGVYLPGEKVVLVSPNASNTTVIHEIVHYAMHANGRRDKCEGEEIARAIAGQKQEWRKLYGCEKDQGEPEHERA